MAGPGLRRTQYWNVSAGVIRIGSTGHGESLTDFDDYLTPLELTRNSALLDGGVADGLAVQATAGAPALTVMPGMALDVAGRPVVLAAGALAVIDPTVDPTQVLNVPTVLVPADGLPLPTAAPGGDLLLTISWREVQVDGALGNTPVLVHAPWVRLVPAAGFTDDGEQVVLAAATVAADGTVTALAPGPRRSSGTRTGHVDLAAPLATGAAAVGTRSSARLEAIAGGGLSVSVSGGGPSLALRIDGATAAVTAAVSLTTPRLAADAVTASTVSASTLDAPAVTTSTLTTTSLSTSTLTAAKVSTATLSTTTLSTSAVHWNGGHDFDAAVGSDGRWRLRDTSAGVDRLAVDGSGRLAVGLPVGTPAQRIIHTENSEIHSGGAAGGFSFADRSSPAFGESPGTTGQRWVWYADSGTARLWSGVDILTVRPSRQFVPPFRIPPLVTVLGSLQVNGSISATGSVSKGGGGFRIDHPLDPQRRHLQHAFVESPEMATLYAGTVVTGDDGLVDVPLPSYFGVLNRDARVYLTAVDSLAAVTQAGPVADNRFTIRSAEPSVTVNWLVTGVRDDPWALANTIVVEEDKAEEDQGHYLHPELHDPPSEEG